MSRAKYLGAPPAPKRGGGFAGSLAKSQPEPGGSQLGGSGAQAQAVTIQSYGHHNMQRMHLQHWLVHCGRKGWQGNHTAPGGVRVSLGPTQPPVICVLKYEHAPVMVSSCTSAGSANAGHHVVLNACIPYTLRQTHHNQLGWHKPQARRHPAAAAPSSC